MTVIVNENGIVYLVSLDRELKYKRNIKEKNSKIKETLDFDVEHRENPNQIMPKGYIGMIDEDYSLIRYLCENFFMNNARINNCGYVVLKRKNGELTSLQRAILEYYSKFEDSPDLEMKLYVSSKYFNNFMKQTDPNYSPSNAQVNHKNYNKLDNRIQNLELVTARRKYIT